MNTTCPSKEQGAVKKLFSFYSSTKEKPCSYTTITDLKTKSISKKVFEGRGMCAPLDGPERNFCVSVKWQKSVHVVE